MATRPIFDAQAARLTWPDSQGSRRGPILLAIGIVLLALSILAAAAATVLPTEAILLAWLGVGALTVFVVWTLRGELVTAVCLWFVSLIVLHEEFWREQLPGFFSLTIPRVGLVLLLLLFLAMLLMGRVRMKPAWGAYAAVAALGVYLTLSATAAGFETRSVASVHYRLVGGYLFPFAVFFLTLHAIRAECDVRRLSIFFALLSVYLTFTGWCEQFDVETLIWPAFIQDPEVGIHWGRVRGPLVMSAALGLVLVFCFFNNLVLLRNMAPGWRWPLYAVNVAMLPVIFWTHTRSVWLSFVACCLIWVLYSRRRTTRVASVGILLALALSVAVVNMDNFLAAERTHGGLTDVEPILLRIGLAKMTMNMVVDHPLFGVGFGHFRDFGPQYARDPSSPYYAFGSTAMEHNNLLSIIAETGVVGIALYLVVMATLLVASIRLYRRLPAGGAGFLNRDLVVLYWILAAAFFVDGTFRETSDNPFANSLFFALSAVPVALNLLLGPDPIRVRSGPFTSRSEAPLTSPDGPGVGGSMAVLGEIGTLRLRRRIGGAWWEPPAGER